MRVLVYCLTLLLLTDGATAKPTSSAYGYGLGSEDAEDLRQRKITLLITDYKSAERLIKANLLIDYYIIINGNRDFLFPPVSDPDCLGVTKYVCLTRKTLNPEIAPYVVGFYWNEPFVTSNRQTNPMKPSALNSVSAYIKRMFIKNGYDLPEISVAFAALSGPGAGSNMTPPYLTDSILSELPEVDTIGTDPYVLFGSNLTKSDIDQLRSHVIATAKMAKKYQKKMAITLQGHKPGGEALKAPLASELCEMVRHTTSIARFYRKYEDLHLDFFRWRLMPNWNKNVASDPLKLCF